MNGKKETQVLAAIRKAEPQKKRVNFFISLTAKEALAVWCGKNGVSESSAIEQMIRVTVPMRFFKEGK
jgi:hypothetical protein